MKRWFADHRRAFADTSARALHAPFATALSLLALGSALALPLAGKTLLDSLTAVVKRSGAEPQLTVYLAANAGTKERGALQATLSGRSDVRSVRVVTKEQALAGLQAREGVRDLLAGLTTNPLPDALIVTPASRDPAAMRTLQGELAKLPGVANVEFDSAWVERLAALVRAAAFVTLLMGILLSIAVVAVSFNTIRLQVLTRGQELEVASLFGATRAYLRRPFLYFGAAQGALAGGLAVAFVQLGLWGLNERLGDVLGVFGLPEGFAHVSATTAAATMLAAAALGWIGAWLAVSRHLAKTAA